MINNQSLNEKYSVLSNNVKKARIQNGMTQEKLAEIADLSISYIKQIESSKEYKNISLTVMLKLSKALNIEVESLFKKNV